MTTNDIAQIQKGEEENIRESLDFIGFPSKEINVEILQRDEKYIVNWHVVFQEGDPGLRGQYILTKKGTAHLSIIMAVGIAAHPLADLIYELLIITQVTMHQLPERNNLGEIAIRWIVRTMIDKGIISPTLLKREVEKFLHLDQNIAEETMIAHIKTRKH